MRTPQHSNNRIFTRKFVITILLMVSFLLTSSTFAYWAGVVEGTDTKITSTFAIGAPLYDNHKFVLNSKVDEYSYKIDLSYLLEDRLNEEEVSFGVVLNEEDFKEDKEIEVKIKYDIVITKNGKELKGKQLKKFEKLFDIDFEEEKVKLNEINGPITFNFDVSLIDKGKQKDIDKLDQYEVYIVVEYQTKQK